ncbi:thioredoxin family protein [Lewinellaceae bacterium SD302]|nr:thioredoxin family protein [Lewinellaceae bacterium SD302]
MKALIEKALVNARDYADYRTFLTQLLAQGKTTGPNQSELYLRIADLNQHRMDRLDRRDRFLPEMITTLAELKRSYIMLVLTEGWCGDAAQIVPLLNHMASTTNKLQLQLVLRDEHVELMDLFLTDGGRSIPKLILLDANTHRVLGDWGPRPAVAQQMSMDYKYKTAPKEDYETHHQELHTWYARNKTLDTQLELIDFLKGIDQ